MILITGANGSIGRKLHEALPDAVGIDVAQWDIRFPRGGWVDIAKPDLVYHLAASKDAPEGEIDPRDVLLTNAYGTMNVMDRWPEAKIVLASTCKACDPETAYGASKLIAERMVLNAGGWVARFHNVQDTQGNVFQTWRETDGPINYTDCWRYFITAQDAVDLLLEIPNHPPGRYLRHPGNIWHMGSVASQLYPDRLLNEIPARRGDRVREPLVAQNEVLVPTSGPSWLYRVENSHDPAQ